MNRRFFISVASLTLLLPTSLWASEISNPALHKTHANIIDDYPSVSHISAQQLSTLTKADVVLFDVREMKEFDVSHLDGAYQVSPSISAKTLMTEFDVDWSGKTVVFYCSVGRRSSILAERLQSGLKQNGAAHVYNLEEGIFGWHNLALPLTNENGATDFVHPYNAFWKRMVNRKELARYKP
jgi:rhodanese-related sulfurtransferase